MLIRISLIVAIVAALAVGALNIVLIRSKIDTLITQRNDYHTERDQARTELANTRRDLAKTKNDLAQTRQDLTNTMTQLTQAQADIKTQTTRANDLADKLTKANRTLEDTQGKLEAYTLTGYTPKQVLSLSKTLKSTQTAMEAIKEENGVLERTVSRLHNQLAQLIGTNYVVRLRPDLKGNVVAVDPKWDFVVLNIGGDQGVLDDGEMLVSRDGRLVAKVIVRSVEKNHSIANVMPGWQLGQIFEGDVVTPAHPAT